MNIFLPIDSQMKLGGGMTFRKNFTEINLGQGNKIVENELEADHTLIVSSTLVGKEIVRNLKKPFFLRIDNLPKESRNRGTAITRLSEYALRAKGLIYQSKWAKEYVGWILNNYYGAKRPDRVIYNGINTAIYNNRGARHKKNIYIYSRFNRDETKAWDEARYIFHQAFRKDPSVELWIIGAFSPDNLEYKFDFVCGEKFKFFGIINDEPLMASLFKQAGYFLAPYYNDACSNTILEAKACGLELIVNYSGGTPEILELEDISRERMVKEYLDFFEELNQ